MSTNNAIDLNQRPPRSPRVRLGGYVILPRSIDKARAKVAGKLGEYVFPGPLDKRLFEFLQLDPETFFSEVKNGKGDWEILEWVNQSAGHKPTPWEIVQWSAYAEARGADSVAAKERVFKAVTALNPSRTDILTSFDLLDVDDHVSFGGQA
jgi:hypothetical protein